MEIWFVMAIILMLIFAGSSLEATALIFIVLSLSFINDYSAHKEEEVEKYCIYFPETEICKAIDKAPGSLTEEQKDKMIQRVKEEDERRKDFKNIQDIEVE